MDCAYLSKTRAGGALAHARRSGPGSFGDQVQHCRGVPSLVRPVAPSALGDQTLVLAGLDQQPKDVGGSCERELVGQGVGCLKGVDDGARAVVEVAVAALEELGQLGVGGSGLFQDGRQWSEASSDVGRKPREAFDELMGIRRTEQLLKAFVVADGVIAGNRFEAC